MGFYSRSGVHDTVRTSHARYGHLCGRLLGIVLSAYTFLRKGSHLPQILLYGITAMLVLLAFTYYFYAASCQPQWYSFTLEVGTLLLILLFYLNRKSLKAYYGSSKGSISRRLKALKPLSYRPVSYCFSALFICSPYCWQALPFPRRIKFHSTSRSTACGIHPQYSIQPDRHQLFQPPDETDDLHPYSQCRRQRSGQSIGFRCPE